MDKLLLYKSLFKGRDDVYAIHWSKGNKSGYMPAKFYDPYFNRTHKKSIKPTDSEVINYLPLTDDQVQRLIIPNKVHQYSAAKYTTYCQAILPANCA